MEPILCPECGKEVISKEAFRENIASSAEKEVWGYCSCGQRYSVRFSFLNGPIISFPDKKIVLLG
jgi:hypothetical protein